MKLTADVFSSSTTSLFPLFRLEIQNFNRKRHDGRVEIGKSSAVPTVVTSSLSFVRRHRHSVEVFEVEAPGAYAVEGLSQRDDDFVVGRGGRAWWG